MTLDEQYDQLISRGQQALNQSRPLIHATLRERDELAGRNPPVPRSRRRDRRRREDRRDG